MTALRQRLIEEMQLRGFAERSIESYVHSVHRLAQHYHRAPDSLSDDEIRRYLVQLRTEEKLAPASINLTLSALKFFYRELLDRNDAALEHARSLHERRVPVVLASTEVWHILSCVTVPAYRVCLTLIYACGLRLMEALRLEVADIDSARCQVHVRGGKGGKDRYVPLPAGMLPILREHWRTHHNPLWVFPRPVRTGSAADPAIGTMHPTTLQKAFNAAVKASGIHKHAHIHTLRHSYATHLLECGVPLVLIQQYLGHSELGTTAVYMHTTRDLRDTAVEPINALVPTA